MMDDLVEWLKRQLDEDERVARAASPGPWRLLRREPGEPGMEALEIEAEGGDAIVDNEGGAIPPGWADAEHIVRHDPARVLREVEAKRLMLAELEQLPHYAWDGRDEYGCPKYTDPEAWRDLYGEGVERVCNCGRDAHVERQRRLLALPLADRPGYQEAWRP